MTIEDAGNLLVRVNMGPLAGAIEEGVRAALDAYPSKVAAGAGELRLTFTFPGPVGPFSASLEFDPAAIASQPWLARAMKDVPAQMAATFRRVTK